MTFFFLYFLSQAPSSFKGNGTRLLPLHKITLSYIIAFLLLLAKAVTAVPSLSTTKSPHHANN